MKNKYTIILLSAVVMASCSGKTKSEKGDTPIVEDTVEIAMDTVADAATDSVPEYYSEDLKKFGLHGRVKTVKTNDYASFVTCLSETLEFNEEGVLTTQFTNFTDNVISCNSDGFIDVTSCRESDGTTFNLEFTNFNEMGNPVAGKYESEGPAGIWEATFNITYDQFDKEGNWLKRTFKGETAAQDINEEGNYGREQKDNLSVTETRTITYYR